MTNIKLKDFCKQNSITYITGYRWFKDGQIPGAYQTDFGTILIPTNDENLEQSNHNDAISIFLKKTVEFSKNNASVEDFAAYIISNFSLRLHGTEEKGPRYSRNKPKPEEVQKHFDQFLKPKGEKPKPNMFVASEETLEKIEEMYGSSNEALSKMRSVASSVDKSKIATVSAEEIPELDQSLQELFTHSTDGDVIRSVNLTPQLNYTNSANAAIGTTLTSNSISSIYSEGAYSVSANPAVFCNNVSAFPTQSADYQSVASFATLNGFEPTQKELESSSKVLETGEKSKRGRKPSKRTL